MRTAGGSTPGGVFPSIATVTLNRWAWVPCRRWPPRPVQGAQQHYGREHHSRRQDHAPIDRQRAVLDHGRHLTRRRPQSMEQGEVGGVGLAGGAARPMRSLGRHRLSPGRAGVSVGWRRTGRARRCLGQLEAVRQDERQQTCLPRADDGGRPGIVDVPSRTQADMAVTPAVDHDSELVAVNGGHLVALAHSRQPVDPEAINCSSGFPAHDRTPFSVRTGIAKTTCAAGGRWGPDPPAA